MVWIGRRVVCEVGSLATGRVSLLIIFCVAVLVDVYY